MSTKSFIWGLILGLLIVAEAQSIDPSSIPIATRDQWCNSQTTACPLLCLQLPNVTSETTMANTCDPATLTYSCICSNGQSINGSEYSQTLPYYLCTYENNQCVENCAQGNSTCQSACRTDNPCGAQNPTRLNTTTVSTMSATAAPSSVSTGSGQVIATASSTKSSGTGTMLRAGDVYGSGIVAAIFLGGFALLL